MTQPLLTEVLSPMAEAEGTQTHGVMELSLREVQRQPLTHPAGLQRWQLAGGWVCREAGVLCG